MTLPQVALAKTPLRVTLAKTISATVRLENDRQLSAKLHQFSTTASGHPAFSLNLSKAVSSPARHIVNDLSSVVAT